MNPNLTNGASTELSTSVDNATSRVIKVKPTLMLGLSTYNPKPTNEDFKLLDDKLTQCSKCELCGASITKEMRHALYCKEGWFNACGMCYYPQNLDLIPYFDRGEILYFPAMDQTRLNTLLRSVWSVDVFNKSGVSHKTFQEFKHAMADLVDKINGQLHGMTVYFDSTNVDVFVAMLDLMRPEEYEQRYKLLQNFRWYPKRDIFKNEITYWAQQDFNLLHPSKIDDNITQFVSNYGHKQPT